MIGTNLGPYRILSELGAGGMGRVYLAEGPKGRVAVKVFHPHLFESPEFFRRFLREAELGRRVVHENVVRTLDADEIRTEGGTQRFLVMEHVEGQTLRQLLEDLGRVPEELCRRIGREVGRALGAIHAAGIVHRDLKPENVLITKEHAVKVMDLGVARLVDEAMKLSQSGGFVGSVHYAAPEQFEGAEADARADWYSLGLVLYELATGQHPSRADDFAAVMRLRVGPAPRPAGQVNPQLSPYFEEVLRALLEPDRARRLDRFPDEEDEWWRRRADSIRRETKRPLRRIRIPRETALYGRDEELRRLGDAFERTLSGEGRVLLLEGEAGIGKTRLVDEFVASLGAEVHFLFGSYPPGGAATPAGAFSTAYREQFGAEGSAPWLRETPLLVPAFDALLHGEPPPRGAEPLTKDSLQAVFVHATRALARERPTILLVDDLHLAPEEGRALFSALSLAVPGHRILLLGTARPGGLPGEWLAGLERSPHVARLALPRLGAKEVGALLVDAFGSERLAEELGFRILTKSDGNPFFVFEILRGLREGRFIARAEDGTWIRTQVIDRIEIPASVLDLIRARIAELGEAECNLLEIASCCGFEFDPAVVADAAGMAPIPALRSFARIEKRQRLVRSAGRRYLFDHHQIQEALYEGLHEQLREQYHAALADAMERRAGTQVPGAVAVELAEHHLRGAQGRRALPHLEPALGHLEAACRNDAAVRLVERALAVPGLLEGRRRADLLLRQNVRLELLGRRAAQRRALDEALEIAGRDGDAIGSARVRLARGALAARLASYEEAFRELEGARDLFARAGDRRGEASATGSLGAVCVDLGRYAEGKRHLERHLALAREAGDGNGEMIAEGNLGNACSHLGDFAAARGHYERSLALAKRAADLRKEGLYHLNLGNLAWLVGELDEAQERFSRGGALAREAGWRQGETLAMGHMGVVSWELGRVGEAIARYSRHREVSREIGARDSECLALVNLGTASALLGRPEEARKTLEEALALSREVGATRLEGYALFTLGEVARDEGDAEAAERLYEESRALRARIGYRRGIAESLLGLGRLAASAGRPGAAALLDESAGIARDIQAPHLLLAAAAHRARLPGGDPAGAVALFHEYAGRVGAVAAMEARFALFEATGDRAHLEAAHALLEGIRTHSPAESRDSLVANVPLHRAIRSAFGSRG